MTVNNILLAVAAKLADIWPERKVYLNEVPTGANNQFFVGVVETKESCYLDRRRKRSVQIEVLYFLQEKDNMIFGDWIETMYDFFDTLTVNETESKIRTIRLTGQKGHKSENDNVYRFVFDADFYYLIEIPEAPIMENLEQKEAIQ